MKSTLIKKMMRFLIALRIERNNNINLMSYICLLKYFSMESYCDITL